MTAVVASRFAALCLDLKGHLSASDYADMGLRGALLVDVALAGRLTQTTTASTWTTRRSGTH